MSSRIVLITLNTSAFLFIYIYICPCYDFLRDVQAKLLGQEAETESAQEHLSIEAAAAELMRQSLPRLAMPVVGLKSTICALSLSL